MPKSKLLAVGIAAVVIAVAVPAYIHFHRFPGGPLNAGVIAGVEKLEVGQGRSFALGLSNSRDDAVTIDHAKPIYVAPGTQVRIWAVTTNELARAIAIPMARINRDELRAPEGFVVSPDKAGDTRDLVAVIEREPTAPQGACIGIKGLEIEYKVGWRRYRRNAAVLVSGTPPGVKTCQPELAE
jgi:hypothetical protein